MHSIQKCVFMNITDDIEKQEGQETASGHSENTALTVEKLRSLKGMESISRDEAEEVILSISQLCAVIFDFMTQTGIVNNTYLINNNFKKAAA